ncbi:hypothetical protein HKT18_10025 [Flavobacterium sp. IMCC34852]|uniref:Sulfotransferase domain-containing protein n=1 Tax=Flavobacterium rivulicola TaxID=2732161 RepID=A0A7Y3R9R1_9FLAO|nr:sulfotransferase domain-containing protein [Flavobacterium sp. IMCC34852]NNT72553.1 hypothetical protein [Flavobacterium sp. IMCC34852]
MNVHLHIGLHKTGTTYLQYNIFPSLKDFHYVQLPPWRILTQANLSVQELEKYKSEILQGWDGQKDLIISNEFFSGAIEKFSKQQLICILDNLKQLFPQAKIIIVLRSPKGYFNSLYNFRVVSRGFCTKSMSDYYAQNKQYFLEKFDYDFLLKAVSDRFSKTSAIKYEEIQDNNQYVAFICKALAIPLFEVSNDVKENTSSKKGTQVKTHLALNRILLSGLLESFPESHLKNYLKVQYFNFKKTKLIKKVLQRIEKSKFVVNNENKLTLEQQNELDHFIKKYDQLHFPNL